MSVASEYMGAMLAGQQFQAGQLKQQQEKQQMDILQQEEPARLQALQQDATLKQLQVNVQKRQDAASQSFAKLVNDQQASGKALTSADYAKDWGDALVQAGAGGDAIQAYGAATELEGKAADTASKQAATYALHSVTTADMLDSGASANDLVTYLHTQAPEILQAQPDFSKGLNALLENPAALDKPYKGTTLRHWIADTLRSAQEKRERLAADTESDYKRSQTREAEARANYYEMWSGGEKGAVTAARKAGDPRADPDDPATAAVGMVLAGAPKSAIISGWGAIGNMQWNRLMDNATTELQRQFPNMSKEQAGEEIARRQAAYGGEKQAARTAGGIGGRVAVASGEIERFAPLAEDAIGKVPRSQWLPINKLLQVGETQALDPNLRRLQIRINALLNAYDVLAARGGTDPDKRRQTRELLTSADSPQVLRAGIESFQLEAQAAGEAANEAVQQAAGTTPIGGGGRSSSATMTDAQLLKKYGGQ